MSEITMKQLLESGVHFGHQTNRWNPKMKPYIYGARSGIYIIDLQKTLTGFQAAEKYVRDMAKAGKKILFVATKKQAQELIAEEATRCGMYYINQRWLGGTLTNFATIRKSIARLHELEKMDEENKFDLMHKKEALKMRREIEKLNKFFRGIKNMKDLPDALFIVDTRKEKIALAEGKKLGIKIIAMVDTNSNPDDVDFPIPANDDAMRSIKLFAQRLANVCLEGQEMSKASKEKEGKENKAEKTAPTASAKPAPVASEKS
ncbi:MAG: 30S ribosomal protein S2 [Nitrospinaceae bacterium]|nr:30S ribosomal protein S2 [Nitrospina sp.]MBT5376995.1 30S ribosomal protein S2 [Nitrospinaceae bacterium]MBT5868267.1 30S ribosomal protein S2 [Nitrospinaceae bacterium]MBT6346390.1 30S ribosomal protein S2 [Nitrospina sp.]